MKKQISLLEEMVAFPTISTEDHFCGLEIVHGQTSSLQTYLVHGFVHGAFVTAVETNTYGKREMLASSSMG